MIENILGSTSKVKILRLLYEYPNRQLSTKDILSDTKIGFGYGLKCLNILLDFDILRMRKVGKQKRYFLNKENKFYTLIEGLFQIEMECYPKVSYLHRGIIAEIIEKLYKETTIIFGSVAAGTATVDSDIDLLVISERKEYTRSVLKVIERNNKIKIQAVIMDKEKLQALIRNKSELIRNISKEKIFLRGDKQLLEMIENV